jgi:hypothetical protein
MSRFISDCRRGSDRWVDLLIFCIRHSELQVITSLLLLSSPYKSLQHTLRYFPASCVFNSHPLATASNSGDSSASRAHIVAFWQISCNWTLVSSQLWTQLLDHLFSAIFTELDWTTNSQLNSLTHQPITSLHFTSLHSTEVHSAGLGSSLYSLGADPTEDTVLVLLLAGTLLPSWCLETGCITPLISCFERVHCGRFLATAAVYTVTA